MLSISMLLFMNRFERLTIKPTRNVFELDENADNKLSNGVKCVNISTKG